MASLLRQRAMSMLFGGGVGGAVAAQLVSRVGAQLNDALHRDAEVLDASRLAVGETYLVTTRPPMNRAERRLTAHREALAAKLGDGSGHSRRTVTAARRLAASQRRVERRSPTSRRGRRAAARADKYGARFDKATARSPKDQARVAQLAEIDAKLATLRADAIASARRTTRPTRSTTFR